MKVTHHCPALPIYFLAKHFSYLGPMVLNTIGKSKFYAVAPNSCASYESPEDICVDLILRIYKIEHRCHLKSKCFTTSTFSCNQLMLEEQFNLKKAINYS